MNKNEYFKLCIEIVQSRINKNISIEKEYSYILLNTIKNHILKEIDNLLNKDKETEILLKLGYLHYRIPNMLFTLNEINIIKNEIENIWTSYQNIEDTNYIGKVNIISLFFLLTLSKYSKNKYPPFGKKNCPEIPDNYEDYYHLKDDINYRFRNEIVIGSITEPFAYFLPCIFDLTHKDLLYYWFEYKIWFLGIKIHYSYVDSVNNWGSPKFFYSHDAAHSISSFRHYNCIYGSENDKNKAYKILSSYYKYCKIKYENINDSLLNILLFCIFIGTHEGSVYLYFGNTTNKNKFKYDILNNIDKTIKRLCDDYDLFNLLPKYIKNKVHNKEHEYKYEIVKQHLFECITIHTDELYDWQSKFLIVNKEKPDGNPEINTKFRICI